LTSSFRISLAELPEAIVDAGCVPTTYHACITGLIPAERSSTGRWSVAKRDVREIGGILESLAFEATRPRRKPVAPRSTLRDAPGLVGSF
jgi:hypothetical protein